MYGKAGKPPVRDKFFYVFSKLLMMVVTARELHDDLLVYRKLRAFAMSRRKAERPLKVCCDLVRSDGHPC